jgi:hypothetical protein
MNEQGIQRIAELAVEAAAKTVDIGGQVYAHKGLEPKYLQRPKCEAIKLSTLSGLVDLLKADPDVWLGGPGDPPTPNIAPIIHVVSPTRVELRGIQRDDDYRTRDTFVVVEHVARPYSFGAWLERELFQISLMSLFVRTKSLETVLGLIGNMVAEQKIETKDDGFTQGAVARSGVAFVAKVEIPNPIGLAPFRSFPEVKPVTSEFLLRVRGGDKAPIEAALFEADGGAWAVDTAAEVSAWLQKQLAAEIEAKKLVIVR